jgi:hypothetical protein
MRLHADCVDDGVRTTPAGDIADSVTDIAVVLQIHDFDTEQSSTKSRTKSHFAIIPLTWFPGRP